MSHESLFQAGGTLAPNHASYLTRAADEQMLRSLLNRELVYVLDSRQKGKSSLIGHVSDQLQAQGVKTVWMDLQRFGANLTAEQWYGAMLRELTIALGSKSEASEFWKSNMSLGPMRRFFAALESVFLPVENAPIVLFIDEIDFVKALPFNTDEFFAGIREWFNRHRCSEHSLTFCLVGVSSPRSLILDPNITPFNVGTRIPLADFSRSDLTAYESVLPKKSVDEIFQWTDGHPYLTQLIASIAISSPRRAINEIVSERLLSASSLETEPNFADTERRLLVAELPSYAPEESRIRILDTYGRVLRGEQVEVVDEDPVITELLLSGVVAVRAGRLVSRNNLYSKVFGPDWIQSHMPGAELRRQAEVAARAIRQTWLRAATLGIVLLALCASLFVLARERNRAAEENIRISRQSQRRAYEFAMQLLPFEFDRRNMARVSELSNSQSGAQDAGWEAEFWRNLLSEGKVEVKVAGLQGANPAVWIERGELCRVDQTGVWNGKERLGDPLTKTSLWLKETRGQGPITERYKQASDLESYLPNTKPQLSKSASRYALGADTTNLSMHKLDGSQIWSKATHATILGSRFSLDEKSLMVNFTSGTGLYRADTGELIWLISENLYSYTFDSERAVATDSFDRLGVYNMVTGQLLRTVTEPIGLVSSSCKLRTRDEMLVGGADGIIRLIHLGNGKVLRQWIGHTVAVGQVTTSADDSEFVSLGMDGEVRRWSLNKSPLVEEVQIADREIPFLQVTPDGTLLFSSDYSGKLVALDRKTFGRRYTIKSDFVNRYPRFRIANDGRFALERNEKTLEIRNISDGTLVRTYNLPFEISQFGYFSNESLLIAGSDKGVYRMDLGSGGLTLITRSNQPATALRCDSIGRFQCVIGDQQESLIWIREVNGKMLTNTLETRSPMDKLARINSIQFSPDGQRIAVAYYRWPVRIFDLNANKEVVTFYGHLARPYNAQFSPDGSKVVSHSFDGTARIWDSTSGKQLGVMKARNWVSNCAWSPDGRRIAVGSADGTLRLIDGENGAELFRWEGHNKVAAAVVFSPDGDSIFTSDSGGTLRRWSRR